MLLRNSISSTKKFFKKTLQNFKSFFSGGSYQKLPKTSPFDSLSYTSSVSMNAHKTYKDLDKFYADFTDGYCDSNKEKVKKRSNNNIITSTPTKQKQEEEEEEEHSGNFMKLAKPGTPAKNINQIQMRDEARCCLVVQKLKEIEMMDVNNLDHVLDIEEVLHYYSRLTCPAYLDIVDNFFLEIYAELLGPPSSARSINSGPRPPLFKSREKVLKFET